MGGKELKIKKEKPTISRFLGIYVILSHSDFTGGCGISPHRLLGLSDSSVKNGITAGWLSHPKNIFFNFNSRYSLCQAFDK